MLRQAKIFSFLIILFYAVGLAGFLIPPLTNLFKQLVPFHLLLMAILLAISHPAKNLNFWITALIIYFAGYLIELIGVRTGVIFGKYKYGPTLGVKFMDIPLMIGVNWFLLVYAAGAFVSRFEWHIFAKSLFGALLLTFTDFLIEPVAIKFDYWSWFGAAIPIQNYIAWFIFSFFLFVFYFKMNFTKQNQSALVLLFVQTAFFIALNLWGL